MTFCECIKWVRTEQSFRDKHHKNCPKYVEKELRIELNYTHPQADSQCELCGGSGIKTVLHVDEYEEVNMRVDCTCVRPALDKRR